MISPEITKSMLRWKEKKLQERIYGPLGVKSFASYEERTLVVYLLICNTLNSPSFFITNQEKLPFPKDGIFTS